MDEKKLLEKFKAKSEDAKREHNERLNDIRDNFQIDRDRILYSNSFRRLSGKTQVFVSGYRDHIRTRLTHTLEVVQIATTISEYLGLNATLTEAIALGHDIGHTPFGHAGEKELNRILGNSKDIDLKYSFAKDYNKDLKGFKHNWQGIRILTDLEKVYKDFNGLNITDKTLWGILHHTDIKSKDPEVLYSFYLNCFAKESNDFNFLDSYSLEAHVVKLADEIAQRHHDVEDALYAGIIDEKDIEKEFLNCFKSIYTEDDLKKKEEKYCKGSITKVIVGFYVESLIKSIKIRIRELGIKDGATNITRDQGEKIISFSEDFKEADETFKIMLKDMILHSHLAEVMDGRSSFIIRKLMKAYLSNIMQLPDDGILSFLRHIISQEDYNNLVKDLNDGSTRLLPRQIRSILKEKYIESKDVSDKSVLNNPYLLRTIADYISGMTDKYATDQFNMLYGSKEVSTL